MIIFAVHAIWLEAYSQIISFITGTTMKYMVSMPVWACMIGFVFVLLASIMSFYVIEDVYKAYLKICGKY